MKVIDLLNKIANGEIDKDKIYHFAYGDYCSVEEFMNRYVLDNEVLNSGVETITEIKVETTKEIEKVPIYILCDYDFKNKDKNNNLIATNIIDKAFEEYAIKINEIIDYLKEISNE